MIGPKEQMIVSDGEQGTKLTDVKVTDRDQSSLSDALLNDLVELALTVEKNYDGLPQDIEWAIVDGKISLLQSRPITNLPPPPIEVEWHPPEEIPALVRRQIVENIPDPTCELFDELGDFHAHGLEGAVAAFAIALDQLLDTVGVAAKTGTCIQQIT